MEGCQTDIRYHFANMLENCRPEEIVDDEAECIKASIELGLRYIRLHIHRRYKSPSGCYANAAKFAHFNTILNPNLTDTSAFANEVAICRCPGSLDYYH